MGVGILSLKPREQYGPGTAPQPLGYLIISTGAVLLFSLEVFGYFL